MTNPGRQEPALYDYLTFPRSSQRWKFFRIRRSGMKHVRTLGELINDRDYQRGVLVGGEGEMFSARLRAACPRLAVSLIDSRAECFVQNGNQEAAVPVSASHAERWDLIYLHSEADPQGVEAAIRRWWPVLRFGGVMCGNGYVSQNEQGKRQGVNAVFASVNTSGDEAGTWWVEKRTSAPTTPPAMTIEIVPHCWRYWRCFTYQASGLLLDPPSPSLRVLLHVMVSQDDTATMQRIEKFRALDWPANVDFKVTILPSERLFRRSIGRNLAALATHADVVWFTDCDYIIGRQALEDVWEAMSSGRRKFIFPRVVSQTSSEYGEELVQQATEWGGILAVDREHGIPIRFNRAIGGVQIVSGELCRQFGYLNGSEKWQRPANRFMRCFEDVAFRKALASAGYVAERVSIRAVSRIMHKQAGRDNPIVEL